MESSWIGTTDFREAVEFIDDDSDEGDNEDVIIDVDIADSSIALVDSVARVVPFNCTSVPSVPAALTPSGCRPLDAVPAAQGKNEPKERRKRVAWADASSDEESAKIAGGDGEQGRPQTTTSSLPAAWEEGQANHAIAGPEDRVAQVAAHVAANSQNLRPVASGQRRSWSWGSDRLWTPWTPISPTEHWTAAGRSTSWTGRLERSRAASMRTSPHPRCYI